MEKKYFQILVGIFGLILISSAFPLAKAQEVSTPATPFFTVNVDAQPQYVNFLAAFTEPLSQIGINFVVHSASFSEITQRVSSNKTYAEGGWDLWYNLYGAFPVPNPYTAFTYGETYVKSLDYVPVALKTKILATATETNTTKVKEMFNQIQQMYQDYLPAIPILAAQFPCIFAKNVVNPNVWAKYYGTCLGDRTGILARSTYDSSGGTYAQGTDTYILSEAWNYPGNFLPIFGWSFIECMYLRLVRFDPVTLQILPELAQSWNVSSDGKTYTFHLRPGIVWSDGVPVTADECVTTFNLQMNPAVGSSNYRDLTNWVASLEAPDNSTFTIHLKQPVSFLLDFLAGMYGYQIAPGHVLKDIAPANLKTSDYNTKAGGPVSGWLKVIESVPGQYVKWETNSLLNTTYFSPFKNKYLIFRTVPDAQTALVAVEKQEINSVSPYYNFQNQFPTVKTDTSIQYVNVTANTIMMLCHNPSHPILNNVYVRKAIQQALPISDFIANYQYGFGMPVSSLLYPISPYYNPNVKPISQDLVKARNYMEMAGYKYSYLTAAPEFPYLWIGASLVGGIVLGAVILFAVVRLRKK